MNQSSVEGVVAALLLPAEVAVAAQAAATRNKYDFIFFVGGFERKKRINVFF
jgi:hypothetical protein